MLRISRAASMTGATVPPLARTGNGDNADDEGNGSNGDDEGNGQPFDDFAPDAPASVRLLARARISMQSPKKASPSRARTHAFMPSKAFSILTNRRVAR
jgi:hypothetical protein